MKLIYLLVMSMLAGATAFAAPVITCPTNIVVDCGKASEPVTFTATARDDAGRDVPTICEPPSGTVFSLGTHRVLCTATDRSGTSTCTFLVEVEDTTPPRLVCPSNIVVQATSGQGAVVSWSASATDDCGPASAVTCRPPTGSVFPLGRTPVTCTASDRSGNAEFCTFLVSVLPPPPLRIVRTATNIMLLRWTGNQALQESRELRPVTPWRDSTLPVLDDNREHLVYWINGGSTHFFRLRPIPFPDTRDTDGDGVPDSRDRCPETPSGTPVDEFGCSAIDVVRAPEQLLEAVRKPIADAANLLAILASETNIPFAGVDFSGVMRYSDNARSDLDRAIGNFGMGNLCAGSDGYESALTSWDNARLALEALIRAVTDDWQARTPRPSDEGDVRSEEGFLINLEGLAADMQRARDAANATLPAVQSACRAVLGPVATRGRVTSVDDAQRIARLDGGETLVLPSREMRGNFAEGIVVDVTGSAMSDGSIVATAVDGTVSASADVLYPKTVFRIAPVQPFPPEGSGPYTLHSPEAYQGPGSRIILEGGMRLAAASIGGFSDGPQSTDSLKIELKYEKESGGYTTRLAASALKPGDAPVTIPAFLSDKKFLGDEQLVVTLQTKNPTNNTLIIAGTTNIPVHIVAQAAVCSANYDRTEFELVDPNDYTISDITFVASITPNPFLFGPTDPSTTPIFEYRNFGGTLRQNSDPFFLFNDWDPSGFDPGVYNNGSAYQKGVNYPAAITWPRYRGKRNKRPFWYSVSVPPLVRDRVSACNNANSSYYKLPMHDGWPTWTMGQGNMNPGFTHCPGCYNQYAFDFVAGQGTQILAARGGAVLDFIESRSQNCWNSQTKSCTQNCPGANWLKIQHVDGTCGVYMHMPQNSIGLSKGQRVYRGDSIAIVGNVGCSSNPHLHFQADPYNGASLSMQISFRAYNVCFDISQWPFYIPCDFPNDIRDCYIPDRDEILLSTQ